MLTSTDFLDTKTWLRKDAFRSRAGCWSARASRGEGVGVTRLPRALGLSLAASSQLSATSPRGRPASALRGPALWGRSKSQALLKKEGQAEKASCLFHLLPGHFETSLTIRYKLTVTTDIATSGVIGEKVPGRDIHQWNAGRKGHHVSVCFLK